MGMWRNFKAKTRRKHQWVFASYTELPSERADNKWYTALLFRDEERTVFGIREFIGELPHAKVMHQMAVRVISDAEFRNSLTSGRDDLRKWWKRH